MVLQYKPSAEIKAKMDMKRIDDLDKDQAIVYQLKDHKMVPIIVRKGLSNLTNIEIVEGLKDGDEVILQAKGARRHP